MKIVVTAVLDAEEAMVAFSCATGAAWGKWSGDGAPNLGEFNVEIDIPDEIRAWSVGGENIFRIEGEYRSRQEGVRVHGVLESMGDDLVNGVRVGSDILLVETSEVADAAIGDPVSFIASYLSLYPYSI